MPKPPAPSNKTEISLLPPGVIGVLPAVPGGEENLLPKDAWLRPLRVEFGWWGDPSQVPILDDVIQLIWDGDEDNPVAVKQYAGSNPPVLPPDLWLEVPVARLDEGVHTLYYRLLPWNGSPPQSSASVTVTIDKTAPVLATPSQLIFPPEVLDPNKLTARYLEQNGDQVKVAVPGYTAPRPWDRITWYWGERPSERNPGGVVELDDTHYTAPVTFDIPGDLIRARGDGWRFVHYQVEDRAGNVSGPTDFVELEVDATPIPRTLPWASVEQAAGTGEQQTFDPLDGASGAVVVIPDTAVIYPGETSWVQWGLPGSLGEYQAREPINPGGRRYQIPMRSVAAYMGKTLSVSYFVVESGVGEYPSIERRLNITALQTGLPRLQCQGLSGGNLSYASVPGTGAPLTLATWPLMTIDQHIRIRMTGIAQSGAESHYEAILPRAITTAELGSGIKGVTVSKTFLNTLQRSKPLTGKVYVSFDGGQTWPPLVAPNFPLLQLTFVA